MQRQLPLSISQEKFRRDCFIFRLFTAGLGRVWTALRWQVRSEAAAVLLVGAAMCPACHAALKCAAGHDAFRADQVPTNSTHSKCTGQNGFSCSGGFNRLCASAPVRPFQHRQRGSSPHLIFMRPPPSARGSARHSSSTPRSSERSCSPAQRPRPWWRAGRAAG